MVNIRSYKDKDYNAVKDNLKEANLFFLPWDKRNNLKSKIYKNPNSILVAEIENKVVGNVFIIEDGWSAFIFHLCVNKKNRNNQIGMELLKHAEKILKKRKVKQISTYVRGNKKAQNFYKKEGYKLLVETNRFVKNI